ncbi:hypothetical protein CTheo_6282 [Ceratobasidium theobromae]|uniref:Uncharacterized protein n=1 Tax=Ceratobasidium theobromae TaxID=1582974 RepID=A0A5N5QFN7_9AGAM|nr:hypothetical protein CTheo_6282 [Ceratobasidium theobromae]
MRTFSLHRFVNLSSETLALPLIQVYSYDRVSTLQGKLNSLAPVPISPIPENDLPGSCVLFSPAVPGSLAAKRTPVLHIAELPNDDSMTKR